MLRIALWTIGLLFSAVVILFAAVEIFGVTSEFSLQNNASEAIAHVSVNVVGKSFTFDDIEPGARVTGRYRPNDSSFVALVEMRSGKVFDGVVPYITHSIAYRHDVVVSNSGIEVIETIMK